MSDEPIRPIGGEEFPKPERIAPPVALFALFFLMLFSSLMYLEGQAGGFSEKVYPPYSGLAQLDNEQFRDPNEERRLRGVKIFNANCSPCHQTSGLGVAGQFPPIAGSDWVNAKGPGRVIRIVLNGVQGPIKVNNLPFNNAMVPWKDTMNDEDIAAVITFIRGNKDWGNTAGAVTPEQVSAIRAKIKSQPAAWNPDDLLKVNEDE